jgi:probable HAF family extracellular repeat protein
LPDVRTTRITEEPMQRLIVSTVAAAALVACRTDPVAPSRQRLADAQTEARYALVDLGDIGAFGQPSVIKINERGQIAGTGQVGFTSQRSFLWDRTALVDLGSLGGDATEVAALNARGQVVGTGRTATGDLHAFLWSDGAMHDLGTLGGRVSRAAAINGRGQVVGSSETTDGMTHAFLWEGGQMTDLGTIAGGLNSSAAAINERGQVVGSSAVPKYSAWHAQWVHAALWDAGKVVDLGALYAVDSTSPPGAVESAGATDISDQGVVVGRSSVPWASYRIADRGFIWQDGQMRDLGTLADLHGSVTTRISNAGQIAGMAFREDFSDPIAGVMWRDGQIAILGSLDTTSHSGYWTYVNDMNGAGRIVGWSYVGNPFAGDAVQHAYVWVQGVMRDLGSLGSNSFALAVSASGDIAGWAPAPSGTPHLILWQRPGGLAATGP